MLIALLIATSFVMEFIISELFYIYFIYHMTAKQSFFYTQ